MIFIICIPILLIGSTTVSKGHLQASDLTYPYSSISFCAEHQDICNAS